MNHSKCCTVSLLILFSFLSILCARVVCCVVLLLLDLYYDSADNEDDEMEIMDTFIQQIVVQLANALFGVVYVCVKLKDRIMLVTWFFLTTLMICTSVACLIVAVLLNYYEFTVLHTYVFAEVFSISVAYVVYIYYCETMAKDALDATRMQNVEP